MPAKYETEAVVIGANNFGEADRIIAFFTKERGKVRAAAFGSRRPKSLLSGLQLFVRATVELTEGKNLDTVKGFSLIEPNGNIVCDLKATAYASFVAELAGELFPENQPDGYAYDLLTRILNAFNAGRNPRITALFAAWQLLDAAGFGANITTCAECGKDIVGDAFFPPYAEGIVCSSCVKGEGATPINEDARLFLAEMRDFDWGEYAPLKIKRAALLTAEQVMLSSVRRAIGKTPRSLAFIKNL